MEDTLFDLEVEIDLELVDIVRVAVVVDRIDLVDHMDSLVVRDMDRLKERKNWIKKMFLEQNENRKILEQKVKFFSWGTFFMLRWLYSNYNINSIRCKA